MRERQQGRAAPRRAAYTVDVAVLTSLGDELAVRICPLPGGAAAGARERWMLPWGSPLDDETLEASARRIAVDACGVDPTWLEQTSAFDDERRHPAAAELSLLFVAVVPQGTATADECGDDAHWAPVSKVPPLAPRQRAMLDAALADVRTRIDHAPVAFRLLPPTFTLSELQEMYELLLDRPLHKASFRRSLQAARIVEATDEWRSEGRARPAQLFRYAPRQRLGAWRGVRFDAL